MRTVFLLAMGWAGLVLTVPAHRPEDRQAPNAQNTDAQEVCVLGNVRNPSAIKFRRTIVLAEAIEKAGGALPDLKANRAYIVRRSPNGLIRPIPVKNLAKKGPSLKANDIIEVFPKRRQQSINASTTPPCGAWWRLLRRTM